MTGNDGARSEKDQIIFRLIFLAPDVLKLNNTRGVKMHSSVASLFFARMISMPANNPTSAHQNPALQKSEKKLPVFIPKLYCAKIALTFAWKKE